MWVFQPNIRMATSPTPDRHSCPSGDPLRRRLIGRRPPRLIYRTRAFDHPGGGLALCGIHFPSLFNHCRRSVHLAERPATVASKPSAESARGVSPRAAHRTGLEPLDSSGSCHPPKTAVFRRHQRAPPVPRWPIDSGASDPPPSLCPHYRDFITTTGQSAPARRIGTFGLAVSLLVPFPFSIDRQVLKFRALAKMRVTPPSHRTPREQ